MRKITEVSIVTLMFFILFSSSSVGQSHLHSYDKSCLDENRVEKISSETAMNGENAIRMLSSFNCFFTENQGQVGSEDVRFYIRGGGVW